MPSTRADTRPLSADEESVLRSLGLVMRVLLRTSGADLMREQGMTTTDYGVLMRLSEAENRTLRLTDLAAGAQQSLSAISRTVGRLEAEGYVRREKSESDARSFNAVLTDIGLQRLEAAWPTHVASIRRHLFDKLDDADVRALAAAFAKVLDEACAEEPCVEPGCDENLEPC